MRTKYGNKKTMCRQNHFHDSKKEAGFCDELELRKRAKDILNYDVAPTFELQPAFTNSEGKKIRAITYTPDFIVYHGGYNEIVDVKSVATKTQAWVIKWKILQHLLREKRLWKFTIHI
jgi:hypothetical protein